MNELLKVLEMAEHFALLMKYFKIRTYEENFNEYKEDKNKNLFDKI